MSRWRVSPGLIKVSTPGVEPGLSRPQRDVLTTRRCGHMPFAHRSPILQLLVCFLTRAFFSPCAPAFLLWPLLNLLLFVRQGVNSGEGSVSPARFYESSWFVDLAGNKMEGCEAGGVMGRSLRLATRLHRSVIIKAASQLESQMS